MLSKLPAPELTFAIRGSRPRSSSGRNARMPAEVMAYLPNVERVDAHTIRFVGQDMTEISKFIEFTTTYRVDITP
jgi:hypothetical protein